MATEASGGFRRPQKASRMLQEQPEANQEAPDAPSSHQKPSQAPRSRMGTRMVIAPEIINPNGHLNGQFVPGDN